MLKKWFAKVLVVAISITCWNSLDADRKESLPPPGKQIVSEVKDAYQQGQYQKFLKQLHEQFQKAGKAGVLRGIFESAKKTAQLQPPKEKIEKKLIDTASIDTQRNNSLLQAIAENPKLEIVQKVDSVVFNNLSDEQASILRELDSLKYQIPKDTKATIENKIAALEVEYYIKSLLLDIAAHRSKTVSENLNKKKLVLVLEKLDKMETAAKDFSSPVWIEKIAKAKEATDVQRAFKYDLDVLKDLAEGKLQPENPVEEKVKQIMMDYLHNPESGFSQVVENK